MIPSEERKIYKLTYGEVRGTGRQISVWRLVKNRNATPHPAAMPLLSRFCILMYPDYPEAYTQLSERRI
jgi:hypothetical protein